MGVNGMANGKAKILMVDSSFRESLGAEKNLIDFLTDFLRKYEVELTLVFCDNYNTGIVQVTVLDYDLVIVEPNYMIGDFGELVTAPRPKEIGMIFLKAIKSRKPELPVVVFTTQATPEITECCCQNNYAIVGKPVPLEKLGQVVAEKLGLRRSDEVILEELIIRR